LTARVAATRTVSRPEPVLLVEVLSPSTAATDLGDKAAEYLQIPSVAAYIVLAQDDPKAWLWSRTDRTFAPRPEVLVRTEAVIQVASLDLQLPLLEIYADIKSLS
jgi:Uma2 family endonuclease